MGTIIIILLTASIIASLIAIMSFFMTAPQNGKRRRKHDKRRAKNKKRKKHGAPNINIYNNYAGEEGDRDIRITKRGKCTYPPEAKRQGIEKVVYIDVHIADDGHILEFQVGHKGNLGFEEAAYKYIKQWSFKPAIQDGVPVDAWVRVPIRFALKREYR